MATLKKPTAAPKAVAPKAPAKPTPKVAAAGKPAATKPAKSTPPAKVLPDLQVGNIVGFKGYATERTAETTIFNVADKPKLAIIGIDELPADQGGGKAYTVVDVKDYHDYMDKKAAGVADDDASMPAGDMLLESEITRGKFNKDTNSYSSVPEREKPVEIKSIGKMDELLAAAEEPGDYLSMAQGLVAQSDESLFYAGGALAKLKATKGYTGYQDPDKPEGEAYSADGAGWQKFITDNFPENFGVRKAEGYIAIYNRISALPEPENVIAKLNEIGYAKAVMIAGHLTAENADEIVSVAATQTVKQLQVTLQSTYTSESGKNASGKAATRTTVKVTKFEFKLFEDQGVGVAFIIDEAKKKLGMDDSAVFETIVQQWGAEHLGAEVAGKAEARTQAKRKQYITQKVTLPKNHPLAIAQAAALEATKPTNGAAAPAAGKNLVPAGAAKAKFAGLGKKPVAAPAS